jgi:hypothetical protein
MKRIKLITKLIIIAFFYAILENKLSSFLGLMKMAAFASFLILVIIEFKEGKELLIAFSLFGLILLNPLFPFDLNTGIQNEIYLVTAVIVAIWFIYDLFQPTHTEDIL